MHMFYTLVVRGAGGCRRRETEWYLAECPRRKAGHSGQAYQRVIGFGQTTPSSMMPFVGSLRP